MVKKKKFGGYIVNLHAFLIYEHTSFICVVNYFCWQWFSFFCCCWQRNIFFAIKDRQSFTSHLLLDTWDTWKVWYWADYHNTSQEFIVGKIVIMIPSWPHSLLHVSSPGPQLLHLPPQTRVLMGRRTSTSLGQAESRSSSSWSWGMPGPRSRGAQWPDTPNWTLKHSFF